MINISSRIIKGCPVTGSVKPQLTWLTATMRCWSAKPSSSRSERKTPASMSACIPCLKASTTLILGAGRVPGDRGDCPVVAIQARSRRLDGA